MKTSTVCVNCKQPFWAITSELNRGNGKYCSRKCMGTYQALIKAKPSPNSICPTCSTPFYMSPSKKAISKSGLNFCTRLCKDQAQRVDSGIVMLRPSHYGSGLSDYRQTAFANKPLICEDCGYNQLVEILQIHHIDKDRSNNSLSNLRILCPTCHEEFHYKDHSGRYKRISK